MYVTRPLSLYRRDPSLLSALPPEHEGPKSGYLVIAYEETEAVDTNCWGACKTPVSRKLPFPQNQLVDIVYADDRWTVWFIPVLDQPLSSNRYYIVIASGKHKGHVQLNEDGSKIGVSLAIVEKMRWIREKGGYVVVGGGESGDDVVMVEKVEEFKGENGWKRFGCDVLVERFALRRMDGTLLLTWDYKHIHQIQSKWD